MTTVCLPLFHIIFMDHIQPIFHFIIINSKEIDQFLSIICVYGCESIREHIGKNHTTKQTDDF